MTPSPLLQKRKSVREPRASLEPAIVIWALEELLSPALPQSLLTGNAAHHGALVMTGVQGRRVAGRGRQFRVRDDCYSDHWKDLVLWPLKGLPKKQVVSLAPHPLAWENSP